MINDLEIRTAANDAAYQRGWKYYETGAVHNLKTDGNGHYTAVVHGSSRYEVEVDLAGADRIDDYNCDCPAFLLYDGACKHIVAVLKTIQAEQRQEKKEAQRAVLRSETIFSLFRQADGREDKATAERLLVLEPKLYLSQEYNKVTPWLEFRIGRAKRYVLRNMMEFVFGMHEGSDIVFGKDLTVHPRSDRFEERSQKLWELIAGAYEDDRSLTSYSSYFRSTHGGSNVFEQKKFKLSPTNLTRFFEIMEADEFSCVINDFHEQKIHIVQGRPEIEVEVADRAFDGHLSLAGGSLINIDAKYRYLLHKQAVIYKVDEEYARYIKPLLETFRQSSRVKIAQANMGEFFSSVMPEIEKIAHVKVDPAFMNRFEIMPLTAEVYFDYYKDGISAKVIFCYDNLKFNPAVEKPTEKEENHKILIRDIAGERQIMRCFEQYRFRVEKDLYIQENEDASYEFLREAVPELAELADVYYADVFKRQPVQQMQKVSVGVQINDDNLLEVSLHNENFDFSELVEILGSYRLRRRYHRLKDGTFISLEEQQLSGLADFVESTGLARANKDSVKMPLAKAVYLDSLAREEEGLRLERSQGFKNIVRDLKNPVDVDEPVPPELEKILRDYQVTGFCWLSTLARYGLGGILADDMGLGKTLQVIAFLLAQKQPHQLPALVVAPTSLMYNWLEELERFAPQLKALVIAGSKAEREQKRAQYEAADVIITTYNMLKRDIGDYETMRFRYCFLDEAQHIKNPNTQNAKAVKRLHTGGYFALTGTPIENTLTELWSIFDFMMPGYLLSHKAFKQRFEAPIVKGRDPHALKDLNRHIAPFILRRMKKDVLQELPDKVEGKMVNEMTAKQAKVYAGYLMQAKKEFAAALKAHGFEQSRIRILAILTRLRQICCHPSLFLEDYSGGCGKLDMLEEVVEDAVAAGHRMLIFSQFTTMLKIIGDKLCRRGIAYEYLDGQTPAMERMRLVKAFNCGTQPIFLISLKAGGTGLNLTGADMVIHYDPWWNPAVEDQATDRAYRLGQKKNVQVLKFITKNTIEEKIFELQQKKKMLIDQMIQPGENFLSKLSEEEIRDLFK